MTTMKNFLLIVLLLLLGACSSVAKGGGPGPVFVDAVVVAPGPGPFPAFVRSDPYKRLLVAGVRADTVFRVLDPHTGFPVWSEVIPAGKVFVWSADPPVRESYSPDQIPGWVAQAFMPDELQVVGGTVVAPAYGLTFIPAVP